MNCISVALEELCVIKDICINYFSITVTKYHGQGNLQKKMFNLTCGSRGLESMIVEQKHESRISLQLPS